FNFLFPLTHFTAQFTVTGPDHPVTASLGGEAVLSCHLSPRMSAENMEVGWLRSQDSEVVHLYHDGQDQNREQMLEYRGRTELLRDDITNGRVFLRIYDIQPSDNGQYKCFFQSSVFYKDALLELQVAGLGSDPVISVEGHQDGGIRVVCQSSGWNSQPEAQWRDLQGKILPSASENIAQEANGLFQTKIAIVIAEESNQKVSCSVRNPRLDQERESSMALSLAELFFPRVNPWTVALGVILPLLAVLTALASYCFWRQRRAKGDVMRRGEGNMVRDRQRFKTKPKVKIQGLRGFDSVFGGVSGSGSWAEGEEGAEEIMIMFEPRIFNCHISQV
uniref:Ig-like domain-containing protein n=1 Tax=Terrapene triunguis TaxID=2587831 RepID=A0A674JTT4_9SAUR